MPFRYRCPVCATSSRPYLTQEKARSHGEGHRNRFHGDDYPDGEYIEHSSRRAPRRPEKGEAVALAIVAVLVLAGLLHKLTA